jgi:RNA 2',3'-cyclic 3'-phosphodiesterase
MTEEKIRVFCALELSEEIRCAAMEHKRALQESCPGSPAKWERSEKMHLTLKFIGYMERSNVYDLERAIQETVSTISSFEIEVGGTGIFPPHGSPRVLWIGIKDESGSLGILQQRLEENCALAGFPREERQFKPHLTIARLKPEAKLKRLATIHKNTDFSPIKCRIESVLVIQSQLSPTGSHYTELSRHPLS